MFTLDGYSECVVDCSEIEGGLYVNDDSDPTDLKCVCKEGYHMNAAGECRSCEDISWGCDTCDYASELCLSCKYSYLMLTPTNDLASPQNGCVHKLNNCEVPLHEQNKDTFDFDTLGFPMCESCNLGYFWRESYEDKDKKVHAGFCERCGIAIEHCVDCSNGEQCLECSNELLVSPSGEQCLGHIAFCALSSSDYTVNIELD